MNISSSSQQQEQHLFDPNAPLFSEFSILSVDVDVNFSSELQSVLDEVVDALENTAPNFFGAVGQPQQHQHQDITFVNANEMASFPQQDEFAEFPHSSSSSNMNTTTNSPSQSTHNAVLPVDSNEDDDCYTEEELYSDDSDYYYHQANGHHAAHHHQHHQQPQQLVTAIPISYEFEQHHQQLQLLSAGMDSNSNINTPPTTFNVVVGSSEAAAGHTKSPKSPKSPKLAKSPLSKKIRKAAADKPKSKVERNRGACEKHRRDRKRCPLDCKNRLKTANNNSTNSNNNSATNTPIVASAFPIAVKN